MSEAVAKIDKWISYEKLDKGMLSELIALKEKADNGVAGIKEAALEEINDRFYRELEFGTGGLRGILGAGINRMNIYTVRKATTGVAKYINKHFEKPRVAISYDSRINSELFAKITAETLLSNNINVYLYDTLMPAPALSFAVRLRGCAIGIMITASHNPCEYNGYKVYNDEGCQVTAEAADEIQNNIKGTDIFIEPEDEKRGELIYMKEETKNAFYEAALAEKMSWDDDSGMKKDMSELSVVYTPLNGAGNIPVRETLKRLGVGNIHVVKEQELPDGNFPTCRYPNPEKREALEMGIALLKKEGADLLIATDPDCDRIGAAVKHAGGERLLTGNEIGVLLLDFICAMRTASKTMPQNPVCARSIVSSGMSDAVAADYKVAMKVTLTGFKYIGDFIGELERNGRKKDYIFGFEESHGYLSGTYVRDKDAVNAAMLICQMAAYYKKHGKTLADRLAELYDKYGYYINNVFDFKFEGEKGAMEMKRIMDSLRDSPPSEIAGKKVARVTDYEKPTGLPKANVVKVALDNGSGFIARPSGTEPKLKIYIFTKGVTRESAVKEAESLENEIKSML